MIREDEVKPGEIAYPASKTYTTYAFEDENFHNLLCFLKHNEPVLVLNVYNSPSKERGLDRREAKVLTSAGIGYCAASLLRKDSL